MGGVRTRFKMGIKKYTKEVINCFQEQYPEDWKRYESFFNKGIPKGATLLSKEILIYCDLIDDMQFLVDLIEELEDSY